MRSPRLFLLAVGIFFLLGSISAARAFVPETPDDVPDLVTDAEVTDYVIQAPKIYYLDNPGCAPILNGSESEAGLLRQEIGRTAVAGADLRRMYIDYYDTFCEVPDLPDIMSNITSDDEYVYWVSRLNGGLVRMSEDHMIWDSTPPEIIHPHTPRSSELLMVGDYIYMLQTSVGSTGLYRIHKSTGEATQLLTGAQVGTQPWTFQTDEQYLYWRHGSSSTGWNLERYNLATDAHNTIATGPAPGTLGYYPVAGNVVYIDFESEIRSYDHASGTLSAPIYTSSAPADIISITADGSALYFIEYLHSGGWTLYRMPFFGTAVPLFFSTILTYPLHDLKRHESYLFFLHGTDLKRIRTDADAAPLINMRIEGLEITQAIQNNDNVVPLVRGKRTAVRLFVSSDGESIPGVQARLYRVDGSGDIIDGPLSPTNLERATGFLRVPSDVNRDNINDSFTFFLPPDWVDDPAVRLQAELNHYHFPPEPTYTDNSITTATFTLDNSRRVEAHFVLFEYESGGERFRPRYREDFLQTISWIRRAYPLASAPGWYTDPSPGFRPTFRYLFDASLGGNVDRTDQHPECQARLVPGHPHHIDDPGYCAAFYVVCPTLDTIRAAEGLPDSTVQAGMVADTAGFPRGYACGRHVSTSSGSMTWDWDFDGSYADWYAGHEIGHTQERGHTSSDPAYPWPNAQIGDESYRGFDMGDIGLNPLLTTRVYPNEWHDIMSYRMAPGQWISDYTYVGIKNFSGTMAGTAESTPLGGGAYLQISGILFPDGPEADVPQLRLWNSLAFYPNPPVPGDYRIRLLNGSGGELAHYDFTPIEGEDPDTNILMISEFVPFVPGAAQVQITHPASGEVAWSYAISDNAPVVGNVQLVSPPSPVYGLVTLQWTATDADGDDLTYDVLYSDDNGASWQVVQMSLSTTSAEIDTADLPGSTQGRFKVIAHDGLNQGEAQSVVYNVAMKAPTITVLAPADGQTFAYGQEVYFAAEVYDLQDGDVASIEWRDHTDYLLGTGVEFSFSTSALFIGENVVTVTAVNSEGLSAEASITVYVDDEWEMPPATLTVGPDQVGWHVDNGETALQTATISINNSGDGSFTVNVSENAPWLSVSQSGSTTPLQLTLAADPSYLESGETLVANLEIEGMSNSGTQTVIVPVGFAMGFISGLGDDNFTLYLPVILKP